MQIQSGKLYENRTWKYFYPCIKDYGGELNTHLAKFYKLAIGVGDSNSINEGNCFYILIDTNLLLPSKQKEEYKERFDTFLTWLSYQPYYTTDYAFQKDMHMIVIKIPEKYQGSFICFVKGEYSSMYEEEELEYCFKNVTLKNKDLEKAENDKKEVSRKVLTRDSSYVSTFVDVVNKKFKSTITTQDFLDEKAELDFPPNKEEEIFNYREEGQ